MARGLRGWRGGGGGAASIDVNYCEYGCCPPDYTIDWSEVDYAPDKIKEEA